MSKTTASITRCNLNGVRFDRQEVPLRRLSSPSMALASAARRCAGPILLAPLVVLAIAASPASAASVDIPNVCPKGSNNQQIISTGGPTARCAEGVPLMKAWVAAKKPKQFRSYVCGEVKKTTIGFHADKRWFATWQCLRAGVRGYTIWTRY